MRNRKQRKTGAARFFVILALVFAIPTLLDFTRANGELLGRAGETAAVIAAALNMPDGGIGLLEERFRDKIYGDENVPQPEGQAVAPPEAAEWPQVPPPAAEAENIKPEQSGTTSMKPPKIPEQYAAAIISENFAGRDGGTLIPYGAGYIRNETNNPDETVSEILAEGYEFDFSDTSGPQVLILHTHATESFERYDSDVYDTRNTWRSTDNNNNMVAVGNAMQEILEENGIGVLHDTTQHDYPSYNGSYERSAKTVSGYLEEFPSIRIGLDLHRDAMERDNQAIVKPITLIDGKKAAQLMIISGCDDGTMNMPGWRENLRFAAALTDNIAKRYKDLARPVYLCYRKYNMDLSSGSLLIEFGSNANTLEEAVYAAELTGQALAELIIDNME